MRKINKVVAILLVLTMAFSMVACSNSNSGNSSDGKTADTGNDTDKKGGSSSGAGEFVIGCPQALSGTNALVGDATLKGAKLAVKVLHENGGINGEQIRLVVYDDQASPEEAVKIAKKLIEVDKVDAICGSLISSNMLAAGNYYEEAKIPTVGNGLSNTWMEQNWQYVFRACPNSGMAIPLLAQKMQDMGVKTVAIFEGVDDASKGPANTFREIAADYGMKVLTSETCVDGESDFSGQVAKIMNTNPDAVLVSCPSVTQPVFSKQLRQFGYDGIVFSKETLSVDNMAVAGDSSNYWAFVFPYVTYNSVEECDVPIIKDFLELFVAEYGEMPFHDCAYRGWDSIMVLAEAAKNAGTNHDGTAIRDALEAISGLEGLCGTFDFTTGDREGIHTFNSYIIVDGKYVNLDTWLSDGSWDKFKESH